MTDFKVGDYVEIQAGPNFRRWNGRRGTIVEHGSAIHPIKGGYLAVDVTGSEFGIGGWMPKHLVKVDINAEAEAVLGEGYFA